MRMLKFNENKELLLSEYPSIQQLMQEAKTRKIYKDFIIYCDTVNFEFSDKYIALEKHMNNLRYRLFERLWTLEEGDEFEWCIVEELSDLFENLLDILEEFNIYFIEDVGIKLIKKVE